MQSICLLVNGIESVSVVSCDGRSCDLRNDFCGMRPLRPKILGFQSGLEDSKTEVNGHLG